MSNINVIDPDYNWKEAATREGVDYDAVMKSFMDQAYGVVANKAKILFQDPFRLGFEIVHRNEKATKMVGIFAFRVNGELLYAPVFFVNGEIKAADMLYRADVKRFVPLTEDWCARLVRGVQTEAGETVSRNRRRQADAYMDRLAYPQRIKYASQESYTPLVKKHADQFFINQAPVASQDVDEITKMALAAEDDMNAARDAFVKGAADGSVWRDLLTHCADASRMDPVVPRLISSEGPEILEKLASMVGDSDVAAQFLAENYTEEQLSQAPEWMDKKAADVDPEDGHIVFNSRLDMCKSASSREQIVNVGFELIDKRAASETNVVVEEVGEGVVQELNAPCVADVFMHDSRLERGLLLKLDHGMLISDDDPCLEESSETGYSRSTPRINAPDRIYFPKGKELKRVSYKTPIFGEKLTDVKASTPAVTFDKLKDGGVYVMVDTDNMACSDVFCVKSKDKDGDATVLNYTNAWGGAGRVFYAPDRPKAEGRYISDETVFIEVAAEKETEHPDRGPRLNVKDTKIIMDSAGVDNWMRTAGGLTTSNEVTVSLNSNRDTFDLIHKSAGLVVGAQRDLTTLQAQLSLATDFSIRCDKAGDILRDASEGEKTYCIYDTAEKSAYVTRAEGMQDWIESFDPELQVKLDAPQRQVLTTHTPKRHQQQGRYGDTFQRVGRSNNGDFDDDGLPADALFTKSPEELAMLSQQYDMPHIFDHGCLEQLATTSYNVIEQIKQYIPDLESGVDRLFRILFLLRYRPADFEEAYGKDSLMEMEQELSELAAQSGSNLLRMLQRFDDNQYSAQND